MGPGTALQQSSVGVSYREADKGRGKPTLAVSQRAFGGDGVDGAVTVVID